MYLGGDSVVRFYVVALGAILATPGASATTTCRFELLRDGGCCVTLDVALAPFETAQHYGIEQPQIVYEMLLLAPGKFLSGRGAVLAALAAQVDIRCVRSGRELHAEFARGAMISPVRVGPSNARDQTTFQILPDESLLQGRPTLAEVRAAWDTACAIDSQQAVEFSDADRRANEVLVRLDD